jgi:hypothetical protein
MTIAGKTAWTVAAIHFALVIALAAYIARQTRYDGETPMLWLLIARFDIPAYLAVAPFGSRILALPHVSWVEHLTGEWITGEWEPFLAPLITFAILGTAWWLFLGWLAGRLWMLIRPHV